MAKLKIFYAIINCGDGSASATFYESQALADFMDEDQYEGWAEPCTGSLTVETTTPVFTTLHCPDIVTKEKALVERRTGQSARPSSFGSFSRTGSLISASRPALSTSRIRITTICTTR